MKRSEEEISKDFKRIFKDVESLWEGCWDYELYKYKIEDAYIEVEYILDGWDFLKIVFDENEKKIQLFEDLDKGKFILHYEITPEEFDKLKEMGLIDELKKKLIEVIKYYEEDLQKIDSLI